MRRITAESVLLYADHKAKTIDYVTLDADGNPMSWRIGSAGGIASVRPFKMTNPKHEVLQQVSYRLRRGAASKHAKRLGYTKGEGL